MELYIASGPPAELADVSILFLSNFSTFYITVLAYKSIQYHYVLMMAYLIVDFSRQARPSLQNEKAKR